MAALGLDAWLEKTSEQQLPVLGAVVSQLNLLTCDDEVSVKELAEVILTDSNLTSHILRASNSPLYLPVNAQITTVSRSIVQIGFEGVKSICVSMMLIDQLLGPRPRERVLRSMARTLHAAVQARDLMPDADQSTRESVFVAALLVNLGEIVIWAHGDHYADELEIMLDDGVSPDEAARKVLGTDLRTLTLGLTRSWCLGDVLEACLKGNPPKQLQQAVAAVRLGHELADAAVEGWDSPACRKAIQRVARLRGEPPSATLERCRHSATQAASEAAAFGCESVGEQIRSGLEEEPEASADVQSDSKIQLAVLRRLATVRLETDDVNGIFRMALEGIHRGIGLQRAALLVKLGDEIVTRYAHGPDAATWTESLAMSAREPNLFTAVLKRLAPWWIDARDVADNPRLRNEICQRLIGYKSAFVAPLRVNDRAVGCYYADQGESGQRLTADQFEAFDHLVGQTCLALGALAAEQRRRKRVA